MQLLSLVLMVIALSSSAAWAEVRTITATGEYRMGDNDTRADAKRLALQDAKRLALEKAGTYLESITEVKNFRLDQDEIRAYTAGIVAVSEQQTRSVMEGETTVVRVDVICRIDSDVVTRQIDALRKNEAAKTELLSARKEADWLRKENEGLRQSIAAASSKTEIEALVQKRREVLGHQDVNSLLARASAALFEPGGEIIGSSTESSRARSRILLNQALALAPSNPNAHMYMGVLLLEEGNPDGAITEFRNALRMEPNNARIHYELGISLKAKKQKREAAQAFHKYLQLTPVTPANRQMVEGARNMLRELE